MKLNIVVGLYQIEPLKSVAIDSILKLFPLLDQKFENYLLTIYDNSLDNQSADLSTLSSNKISYIHDSRNLGLATAYNQGYTYAKNNSYDWILLLDHDTILSEEYLLEFLSIMETSDSSVAAVVPQVMANDVIISPVATNTLNPLEQPRPQTGLNKEPITAINSGTFVKVEFLKQIDGFTDEFPLDYLDHWLFFKIYEQKQTVFVAKTVIQHDLSILNFETLNLKRYKSILDSEALFYKKYKTNLLRTYKRHLLKQGLKQIIVIKNKKISLYSLKKYFTI